MPLLVRFAATCAIRIASPLLELWSLPLTTGNGIELRLPGGGRPVTRIVGPPHADRNFNVVPYWKCGAQNGILCMFLVAG